MHQDIYVSTDDGLATVDGFFDRNDALRQKKICHIGKLSVTVSTKGFPVYSLLDGMRYSEVRFLVEIIYRGLQCVWRFIIPQGGSFPNQDDWTQHNPDQVFMEEHTESTRARSIARSGDEAVRNGNRV